MHSGCPSAAVLVLASLDQHCCGIDPDSPAADSIPTSSACGIRINSPETGVGRGGWVEEGVLGQGEVRRKRHNGTAALVAVFSTVEPSAQLDAEHACMHVARAEPQGELTSSQVHLELSPATTDDQLDATVRASFLAPLRRFDRQTEQTRLSATGSSNTCSKGEDAHIREATVSVTVKPL